MTSAVLHKRADTLLAELVGALAGRGHCTWLQRQKQRQRQRTRMAAAAGCTLSSCTLSPLTSGCMSDAQLCVATVHAYRPCPPYVSPFCFRRTVSYLARRSVSSLSCLRFVRGEVFKVSDGLTKVGRTTMGMRPRLLKHKNASVSATATHVQACMRGTHWKTALRWCIQLEDAVIEETSA